MKRFNAITLGEWLDFWYNTYKVPNLRPYSLRNIEQMIRLHTPAWLKAMRMAQISVLDVDKALAELPKGRTRVYARQTWHAAFLKACKLGIVPRNVLDLTDNVSYKKKRGKALTVSERRDFLKAIEGKRVEWLYLFYLYTGVRRSEALALTWDDVDEVEGLIFIRGTKTESSYRTILLTEEVKYILEQQRKQNAADDVRTGACDDGRVFRFSAGYVTYTFKALCPAHHLHDLRHTYITLCAESGVNVSVCQHLVGHSTPNMTLSVYTHVMDEYKRREAAKFMLFPKDVT